jgi:hypothetical protein
VSGESPSMRRPAPEQGEYPPSTDYWQRPTYQQQPYYQQQQQPGFFFFQPPPSPYRPYGR